MPAPTLAFARDTLAAANVANPCPFYQAHADGYWNGSQGRDVPASEYRGIATARGYWVTDEARASYAAGLAEGRARRAQ